jgi:hypothetical protein
LDHGLGGSVLFVVADVTDGYFCMGQVHGLVLTVVVVVTITVVVTVIVTAVAVALVVLFIVIEVAVWFVRFRY